MFKKREKVLWATVIIAALSLGAVAVTSTRKAPNRSATTLSRRPTQNPIALANAKSESYVRMGSLWPQLRRNLKALGDRLEKPGKERVTMVGTLTRSGDAQPVAVLLILEFPDHLRLEMQGVGPHHVITFNGKSAGKIGGPLDQSEQDLIETLVYDTGEHFFSTRAKGQAMRALGNHFRLDDGTTSNYSGPYCDIYETLDQINTGPQARQQTKLYYFNSETLLPDRAKYSVTRNGSPVSIEIRLSDWQQVQGQQIARRVTRLENNQPVLNLTISGVMLSARVQDGLFD